MEIIMEVFILKIIGIFIVFAIISGIYLVKLLNKHHFTSFYRKKCRMRHFGV